MAKTYHRMSCLIEWQVVDLIPRIKQRGFRQGCSTVTQIIALRRILEGVKEMKLSAVITFTDFKKAFDSVHRGKIVQAVAVRYTWYKKALATFKVLSPDGETVYFEILVGVLQDDTLAPYLLILAFDYDLRQVISGREKEQGFTLIPRRVDGFYQLWSLSSISNDI